MSDLSNISPPPFLLRGGACASLGLSAQGRARCRASDDMGGSNGRIRVIEMYGGMGGLHRSLELINLVPQGIVFVDNNPTC